MSVPLAGKAFDFAVDCVVSCARGEGFPFAEASILQSCQPARDAYLSL